MKKFFSIVYLLLLAVSVSAQGNWEKPANDEQPRKALFQPKKKVIDPKYLEGAVPEVGGKVVWTAEFNTEGMSRENVYNAMLEHFKKFVKGEEQTEISQVAVVNKETYQIGVRCQEWLVFTNKALELDQTKFIYTIVVDCQEGKCVVKMTNISYKYEEDRPTAATFTAEEWITDKEALNKKKTGFIKGVRKFREKTIDRKDDIFAGISKVLNVK